MCCPYKHISDPISHRWVVGRNEFGRLTEREHFSIPKHDDCIVTERELKDIMYKYDDGRKFVSTDSLICLLRLEKLQDFALIISSNGFAIVPVHSL